VIQFFRILSVPVMLVALPVAAASLAGFFGAQWWLFDVISSFRAQYAVVLAASAAVLALARWWVLAGIAGLACLLNLAVIFPLYLPRADTAEDSARITVLSFNVLAGNSRYRAVTNYIKSVDPDVVFLHEAYQPWEEAVEVADLGYDITRSRTEELIFGTLVLTRPGAQVRSYGFASGQRRGVEVLQMVGDRQVAVLGIHPLAPTGPGRTELRDGQLDWAGEWADSQSGPTVVTGDFNATLWSHAYRELQRRGGLTESMRGFGLQPSYPVGVPLLRVPIDNLLHSADLATVSRQLGPSLGSDHFPLFVELAVLGGS
jgi:endonuclease/exonuclease/phosphatase (EEP) superfamily protein YafD